MTRAPTRRPTSRHWFQNPRLRRVGPAVLLAALTVLVEFGFSTLGGASGWALGMGAALVLAVSNAPLHGFLHRGSPRPVYRYGRKAQRHQLYRDQAVLVWADHSITRRERILLDNLREHLALTFEEAARIERDAIAATAPAPLRSLG